MEIILISFKWVDEIYMYETCTCTKRMLDQIY